MTTQPTPDLSDVRLHVVTGKGGTGKTTVAGALAVALARGGRKVLLMEVENRQGIARLFDTEPLPYAERRVQLVDGGEVWALAVEAEAALLEYLEMFYKIGRNGMTARTLRRLGAIEFATTIAPGMRDVLLTGKMKEAVTRSETGRSVYDAVVLDAPPTGRITRFLNVTDEVSTLAKVGPIKSQSDSVMRVLRSPQTAVHLVTLLEDMPVQETADALAQLEAARLPAGMIVVNATRPPLLPPDEIDRALATGVDPAELTDAAGAVGLELDAGTAKALADELRDHAERVRLERGLRVTVDALGRPVVDLPLLPEIDPAALYQLADLLAAAGLLATGPSARPPASNAPSGRATRSGRTH